MNGLMEVESLPEGWSTLPLGKIITKLVDGSHNPPSKQESGVPMLSARNILNNQIVFEEYRRISEEGFEREHARTKISSGDVLLTIVGTIGRSAVVPVNAERFALQRSVAVITPAGVLPKYLMYQFQAPFLQRHFERNARGTAQKGVYLKTLSQTPILVAPLGQQERIVAEIEKQFSRLDEAVANLNRVKANLKRYKAAVLKAAVEGKLTEDWRKAHPNVEPASKLLERILAERRTKWRGKGKYKEPVVPSSANLLPFPPGWCWTTLDQTLWQLRSGTAETSKRELTEYPVLKSSAVRQGTIDFSDLNYLQKLQSMRPENFLKLGDFLITRLSGSVDYVGCSAVVKSSLCEGIQYPDRIFCGKLLTGVDGTYLSYCFQHPMIRKILEGAAKSTAGHQRISMSDLYPLTLPLPPTAEQVRIVAEVERRLSVIEELEAAVEANLTRADRLRQSILQQAFSGKLPMRGMPDISRGAAGIHRSVR